MMSFKQWMVLLGIYTIYMLIGAAIFISLEKDNELSDREDLRKLKERVIAFVIGLDNETQADAREVLADVGNECDSDFLTVKDDEPLTWSLWNSFFFTFTVITTIGFGHMSPATAGGRIFCIIYAFFGVPLNGILVAVLADIFSDKVVNSHVRAKAKRYETWFGVATDTVLYLVPGFIVFLVIPAAVLLLVEEDWNFLDSFYFAFITLTTIGFGDYVAGTQDLNHIWIWSYKIVMVIWIIFGLGYIFMVITFVQKALKSKKIHKIEQKLARKLKHQATKINQNFHRDLKRLREVVTALSALRMESEDEGNQKVLKRCASQPSLPPLNDAEEEDNEKFPRPSASEQNSPVTKRLRNFRQAFSEAALNDADKKDQLRSLASLGDVALFLEMVESLLQEHEAHLEGEAEDQAHHIVHDTVHSNISDSNSEDDNGSHITGTTDITHKEDLEAGFCNQAFVNDSGEIDIPKKPQDTKEAKQEVAKALDINQRLQHRLNNLLKGVDVKSNKGRIRNTSVGEGACSAGELLGKMEKIVCNPFSNDTCDHEHTYGYEKLDRRSSNSVPGRIRDGPLYTYPNVKEVFSWSPDSVDHKPQQAYDEKTEKAPAGRRWSVGHASQTKSTPLGGQSLQQFLSGISMDSVKPNKEKSSRLTMLTQWVHNNSSRVEDLHDSDEEEKRVEKDSKTKCSKNKSEEESDDETKPQYSRL